MVKLRHCVKCQVMLIDVVNADYIILCNFGGRMNSFEVIEEVGAGRSSGSKKKAGLNRPK